VNRIPEGQELKVAGYGHGGFSIARTAEQTSGETRRSVLRDEQINRADSRAGALRRARSKEQSCNDTFISAFHFTSIRPAAAG
jgi:hypothetical protein